MQGGFGPALHVLPEIFLDEKVVYGALVREQVFLVWTNGGIQMILQWLSKSIWCLEKGCRCCSSGVLGVWIYGCRVAFRVGACAIVGRKRILSRGPSLAQMLLVGLLIALRDEFLHLTVRPLGRLDAGDWDLIGREG